MLKTAGHVKKHYETCCILFEDFKNREGKNATLDEFIKFVENRTINISDEEKKLILKGDMLEILAEIFFKAFSNDPRVGLTNYEPIPLEEDYGVDGFGTNAAGIKVPVQIKYRSNPTELVLYAEMARTYTSAVIQLDIPVRGKDSLYVFTTAYGVTVACETVFKDMLRIIDGNIIRDQIDNNVSFWETAYKEIEDTLLN